MTTISAADVHKIIVACDAGMGSSVMLAAQNGEKPTAAADAWISAHGDRVDSWVK